MAKYYPDIAKGAKGTRALFLVHAFVNARRESAISLSLFLSFFFFFERRRRRRSFRLTLLLLSLITRITTTTDLFTGALSYENKFSLDAKPISGGVRFLFFSFGLVFCFLPREREKDLEREMDSSSSLFFQNKMLALERKEQRESLSSLSLFFVFRRKRH